MGFRHCCFIILAMNSYPETKTFFILGNLCPFTRAESFLPNLKLNTEHLNLFSVALE